MITEILGIATVMLNIVYLILFVIALFKFKNDPKYDLQFVIFLLALIQLTPVIVFENILFIDITFTLIDLTYNTRLMRIFFVLGILAYFVYNLHLLTIEDMPTLAVAITAIITGFAVSSVLLAAHIDPTRISPIFYDPLRGGTYFIFSLMIFNIIGVSGFVFSLYFVPYYTLQAKINKFDILGIFAFFISPMFIFAARILSVDILPVNSIFLITEISFILHLVSYIYPRVEFGYPIHPDLISLSIIKLSKNVVIAGYSSQSDDNFNKLQGMTILAVDSVITDVFETTNRKTQPSYTVNYGDTILIKQDDYLLVSLIRGKGKKMGRYLLRGLIRDFIKPDHCLDKVELKQILDRYLYPFFKKKVDIKDEHVYISSY